MMHEGLTWDDVLDRIDPTFVAADVEHDANIETRIPGNGASLGISIAGYEQGTNRIISHYYPFRHIDWNVPSATGEKLRDFFHTRVQNLIMFNAKNDLVTMADLGINYTGRFFDPLIMEHWNNGKYYDMRLDSLSQLHGGEPKKMSPELEKIINGPGKNKGWQNVPYFMMREYGAHDSVIEFQLFWKLWPTFQKHLSRWDKMQDFIRCIIRMERTGIRLDKRFCEIELEYGTEKMLDIQDELGLNPSSPKDMYELFINRLGLKVLKKTPGGKPSFTKDVLRDYDIELARLNSPVAKMVREYRGWQKTISSNYGPYLELLGPDGRLRPNFNFHATITSRLSADRPALQQIPKLSPQSWNGELRKAFIASPGYTLWSVDKSQLELRIIAHYANDTELMAILNNPNRHLFREMAARLRWAYDPTKTFVYSVSYGAGVKRIMEIFGVDAPEATRLRDQFYVTYPKIAALMKECKNSFVKKGYIKLWTGHEVRNRIENKPYAALDYLAQGGGAEIIKDEMVDLDREIDWLDCRMNLQVHDEVMFEIRNGKEGYWLPIIKEIMEKKPHSNFNVNFPVAIKRWGTKDEVEVTYDAIVG